MPDSVSGILVENTEDYMAYDLNSGLFAGGRFLLWINDGRFEGSTPSMEAVSHYQQRTGTLVPSGEVFSNGDSSSTETVIIHSLPRACCRMGMPEPSGMLILKCVALLKNCFPFSVSLEQLAFAKQPDT